MEDLLAVDGRAVHVHAERVDDATRDRAHADPHAVALGEHLHPRLAEEPGGERLDERRPREIDAKRLADPHRLQRRRRDVVPRIVLLHDVDATHRLAHERGQIRRRRGRPRRAQVQPRDRRDLERRHADRRAGARTSPVDQDRDRDCEDQQRSIGIQLSTASRRRGSRPRWMLLDCSRCRMSR